MNTNDTTRNNDNTNNSNTTTNNNKRNNNDNNNDLDCSAPGQPGAEQPVRRAAGAAHRRARGSASGHLPPG